jgi:outer membrane protein
MKFKSLLFSILLFSTYCGVQAQTALKIGHVNVQELVQKHPTMDSIQTILNKESADMQEIYDEMLAEHEKKLAAFEAESAGYSDFAKKAKQTDLMELAQKIQAYNQSAQQQIQKRNMELIQPVYTDINQKIANIAGYDKFTYILDVSNGSVAYISPESSDITARVLEELKK